MPIRTWKIKLKNGHLAKDVFKQWFNDYKYSYNKANWLMNDTTAFYTDIDLRNLITPKHVNQHIPWILNTPKDIRAEAVFENVKNWKSAFTNLKNKNINHFEMGFLTKRKHKNKYAFSIPGSAIRIVQSDKKYDKNKRITIYTNITNGFVFHLSECIPKELLIEKKDCIKYEHKLVFDGVNYYLHLSIDREFIDITNPRKKIVSLDPGVRKFQTSWDNTNKSYFFGTRKSIQIKYLLKKRNKYQSSNDKINFMKIEIRIKNLINELHHDTSTFLCKRYNNIILPKLNVRDIIKKKKNKYMSKDFKNSILRLKHCEFIDLLKTKAELYKTNILSDEEGVHERYSSRMCSRCKFTNPKSSNEWKICGNCMYECDRDINGAKNIYYMNKHLVI